MKTKNEILADLAGCDVSIIEGWKEMGGYVPIDKVLEAMDIYAEQYGWIGVSEQEPPSNAQILAKSPSGMIHLTFWRNYNQIFSCQEKTDDSIGWEWKSIESML